MSQDGCTDIQGSSVETYLKLLKKDPNNVDTLVALGSISASIDRTAEARIFFHRALALEPWNNGAKQGIVDLPPLTTNLDIDQLLLSVTEALSNNINKSTVHVSAGIPIEERASAALHKGARCLATNGDNRGDTMTTSNFNQEYYSCTRPEIQQLVKPTARRILDVGCAVGMLGYELKQKLDAEVWGVEFMPMAAKQAGKRLDRVLQGPIEKMLPLLPDGYFDTIIMADVLEHLTDPWQVLTDIRKKLATGGEIVASIPNVRYWSVVKSLLEGRWQYEDAGILDRTHLRFFTKHDAVMLFETAGYMVNRGEAINFEGDLAVPQAVITSLAEAGLKVDTLAEESRHYQYLLVARPAEPAIQAPARSRCPSCSPITSIVMLTWNQLSFTQACLASIAIHTPEPYELIIVDNGSSDGTQDWLKQQAAQDCRIKIILNESNRGFAAGCNQGVAAASGNYFLLLNNDTVVTPDWLSGLHEVLSRYPDAGIIGPMTNSASGVQVVADVGYDNLDVLPAWAMQFRENNRYRAIPQRRIVGFCMLFHRELVDKIGLLDESFGSGNYEDDDYCLRAELAGYRNLIAGDVFIHHVGGASFSGNNVQYTKAMRDNRQLFKEKWNPEKLDEVTLRRWLILNALEEAEKLAQRGELDQAVQLLLNQGIRVDSADPRPYVTLAEILIREGRFQDALEVLPEMPAAVDPALKQELAAICHCGLGNDAAALQAAHLATGRPRALTVLGTLAARQGDPVEAERLFRQAIQTDPACGSGWLSLGMLLWGQGQQEEAWQAVKQAVTVDPLNQQAVQILRDMAERLG